MWKKSALLAGVIAGIASPATMIATPSYPKLQGSDMSRMRGDIERVGNDFRKAINGRYIQTKASAGRSR